MAFSAFPLEHWRKVWSTNPLERLHREIKRRCDVLGVFPNDAAIDRLVTAVIVEQHDEWPWPSAATCRRPLWLACANQTRPRHRAPHEHDAAWPAEDEHDHRCRRSFLHHSAGRHPTATCPWRPVTSIPRRCLLPARPSGLPETCREGDGPSPGGARLHGGALRAGGRRRRLVRKRGSSAGCASSCYGHEADAVVRVDGCGEIYVRLAESGEVTARGFLYRLID